MITLVGTIGESKVKNVMRNGEKLGIITPNFSFIPTKDFVAFDYIELRLLAEQIEKLEKDNNHRIEKFFIENGE